MTKYYAVIHFNGGDMDEDNYGEFYNSEADAEEAALYAISCANQGAEILHMSNPGDYPYDESDYEDIEYTIEEIEV